MKVYYHRGENWSWTPTKIETEADMLALSFNNWDDYGVGSTFNAALYFDGKMVLEFSLKILIENDRYSPKLLNKLRDNGWDGYFPINGLNYVSVPSDIGFYQAIFARFGLDQSKDILLKIRDAGYLKNIVRDADAIRLIDHEDFEKSPLREGGARKSFSDGWRIFGSERSSVNDFTLNFRRRDGGVEPICFRFNSKVLPYDINILIGQNGVGKSYTIKSLVEYWLGIESGDRLTLEKQSHTPFDSFPNISKLILISYSPFEEFSIDISNANLLDKEAYKYFGFRQIVETEGGARIGISRNLPASDSVNSLLKAFEDDKKFGFLHSWQSKLETILSVLSPAIGFDSLALEINPMDIDLGIDESVFMVEDESRKYMLIDSARYELYNDNFVDLSRCVNFNAGVVFLRGGKKVEVSSGQRLFSYIVINVVGQIRADSLIVIDEPELFLHPTLEIKFIALLKQVLIAFNSKAILATHSLAIAREVPANCIHVYRKLKDEIEVDHPPFETFGGDMQRISSYVFGDNSVSKPFDEWIEKKIAEVGAPRELVTLLGKELNEELLIKILNFRRK